MTTTYPDKPLRQFEDNLTVDIRGDGNCAGELDGREDNYDVRLRAYRKADRFGCNPGSALDNTPGILEFVGTDKTIASGSRPDRTRS